MDGFELAPDPVATPLPIGNEQPAPKQDKRQWMKLALLMAAAAKGGPGAVEGVLHGMQQSNLLQQQQARQGQQDALAQQRYQDEAQFRRDTVADRDLQRRQGFLDKFQGGLSTLEDDEAVRAYLQLHQGQASAFGVNPADLETYTMQAVKPSTLQRRQAEKYIGRLKNQYGTDWMQQASQFGGHVVGGETLTLQQVLERSGQVAPTQPVGSPSPPKVDAPNTPEEQFYQQYAVEHGKKSFSELSTSDQAKARKQWMQADDRPQPQATVLIQTVDANGNPVQQFVQKQPGQTFAPAPTAGQQTAMAEQETSLAIIGDIDRLYKPEYIGPAVGRMTQAQMALPGAPDVAPEVAEFYSAVASLRNEIIKLMSGAAVSGSEEVRMKAQIPDVLDKPSAFVAKLNQTRRNRETLLGRLQARSGQPGTALGGPSGPAIDLGGGIKVRPR